MNIEKYELDMFNKIENFILKHIHNKDLYNNDLSIGNEVIRFSIGSEKFSLCCDYSYKEICDRIEHFISYYNF